MHYCAVVTLDVMNMSNRVSLGISWVVLVDVFLRNGIPGYLYKFLENYFRIEYWYTIQRWG